MTLSHSAAVLVLFFFTAGGGTTVYDGYNDFPQEDVIPQLDYSDPYWCHPPSLTNGEVTCQSPRGRASRSTLGTRCEMTCDRGYRLLGRNSIQCLPSRRWSGTAYCRKVRCHVLPLIPHGRYTCTQGFVVDSRCDFTCAPGYRIAGEHSRTCLTMGSWSGGQPVCSDTDPPKIKCPPSRLKVAEPGKLTARVTWDPPTATDTADKYLRLVLVGEEPDTDFKEGASIIRYKVFDQANNRAACKFIVRVEVRRCPELLSPLHGYVSCTSDGNNYGATCEYHCEGGHERRGMSSRVCQFDRSWSGSPAECVCKYWVTYRSCSPSPDATLYCYPCSWADCPAPSPASPEPVSALPADNTANPQPAQATWAEPWADTFTPSGPRLKPPPPQNRFAPFGALNPFNRQSPCPSPEPAASPTTDSSRGAEGGGTSTGVTEGLSPPPDPTWRPPADLSALSLEEVSACLRFIGLPEAAVAVFQRERIDGSFLVQLTEDILSHDFHLSRLHVTKITQFIQGWRPKI